MADDPSIDQLMIDQPLGANFFDLTDQIVRRYRDLALEKRALASENERLVQIVEGLLGMLGKYVDENELARWRAMAKLRVVPR